VVSCEGAPGSQLEYNYRRFPDGLPPIEYDHVQALLDTLDDFCSQEVKEKRDRHGEIVTEFRPAGPGANEQYIESLELFFPLHNQEELSWLRKRWGSWDQLWATKFRAKEVEGAATPCWNIMDDADPTKPYSPDEPYNVPTVILGCLYQPLDEIRDYFGDDNAIYFSWLVRLLNAPVTSEQPFVESESRRLVVTGNLHKGARNRGHLREHDDDFPVLEAGRFDSEGRTD
jgi:hypothetical protein